jgi:predicted Zn-dependent protease
MLVLTPAFLGEKDHKDRLQVLLDKFQSQPSKSYLCRCVKEVIHEIDQVITLKA